MSLRVDPATLTCLKSAIETLEKVVKYVHCKQIKTPKQRQWHRYEVFIVNFEQISHIVLVFILINLNW